MNNIDAINLRISRRNYLGTPIDNDKVMAISNLIAELNIESGLNIEFIEDAAAAFSRFDRSYGVLTGVKSAIALSGPVADPNLKEKCGYYGEKIILEATKLELGTCWVGGTYNRESDVFNIGKDNQLICVIAIGNVADKKSVKEKIVEALVHRKTKTIYEMIEVEGTAPEWFIKAMEAVQKAPTAINSQKAIFKFTNGEVKASVPDTYQFDLVDLGICKLHFELATGGKFELGNGASFKPVGA